MKRVAFYLRVSTTEQTIENQQRELEAAAKRNGWQVAQIFEDAGISGAKDRTKRPGLDKLLKAVDAHEIDMIAAWSVDRLGRSLIDLLQFLQELHAHNIDLYLHQQNIDTSTPAGRALFQMIGVFAEFERAMFRERIVSGMARAKANGIKFGRPPIEESRAKAIIEARKAGKGLRAIARQFKTGPDTVRRLTCS